MTTPRFNFTHNHETARHAYEEYIKDRAVDIQACLEVKRTVRLEGETQVLVTILACGNCAECTRRGVVPARTVVYRDWCAKVDHKQLERQVIRPYIKSLRPEV